MDACKYWHRENKGIYSSCALPNQMHVPPLRRRFSELDSGLEDMPGTGCHWDLESRVRVPMKPFRRVCYQWDLNRPWELLKALQDPHFSRDWLKIKWRMSKCKSFGISIQKQTNKKPKPAPQVEQLYDNRETLEINYIFSSILISHSL